MVKNGNSILNWKIETVIKHQHAFDATLSQSQKAYYHFLRGKLLAVLEKYSPASEVDLQKSVKLDPMNTFAWNALGEVYWKKGVLENSKRCFAMGLKMVYIYTIGNEEHFNWI